MIAWLFGWEFFESNGCLGATPVHRDDPVAWQGDAGCERHEALLRIDLEV